MAINIQKLFPIVKQEYPNVADNVLLQKMTEFSKKYPNMTDQQAIQAFQMAMEKAKPKNPTQKYLSGQKGVI